MNILAVDAGLANLGWSAIVDGVQSGGTVLTSKIDSLHSRLIQLTCGVPHRPFDYLVIENCFGPAKTKLDYVIGTLIASVDHKDYLLVSPAKWKKKLCPKGKKETYGKLITKLVTKRFGYAPDTQHHADALGILAWFQDYGLKELTDEKAT